MKAKNNRGNVMKPSGKPKRVMFQGKEYEAISYNAGSVKIRNGKDMIIVSEKVVEPVAEKEDE